MSDTADTADAGRPARPASRPPSTGSLDGGRFTPGAIVDARYRIVALRGRGGMGEVYRAEDLRLGETVALKFLPERLVRDGAALARFHREVRTARLITHRNVVRVHDLGEIGGQPFLSMEYVDGEDLASLLRRIGRLPSDKAVELAHQLCAGLAAAHERGVLHRDLKPANVLVDGEGRAKITDFGLAALATDLESPELAGTPSYMAPEQLGEGRVSFASDIYSLGLVLFEMFTGRRPWNADSPAQLLQQMSSGSPPRPSSRVEGLDARVDDAVLRCLHVEPERRARSALDVSGALPGGDPLAAAMAAGETPSPEMVARARGVGALTRPAAAGLLALFLAGAATLLIAAAQSSPPALAPPLPPEVLAHQARSVLASAGFSAPHDAWAYGYTPIAARRLASERHGLEGWREVAQSRPGIMEFWYRQSQAPLVASKRGFWRVTPDDPPRTMAGAATVTLDGQGRLRSLLIVPAEDGESSPRAGSASSAYSETGTSVGGDTAPKTLAGIGAGVGTGTSRRGTVDWEPLFAAAELSLGDFEPVLPVRTPPIHGDLVMAWRGSYPGQSEPRLAIDAAARGGEVFFWEVREELPAGADPVEAFPSIALAAFTLMWVAGAMLARRHLRSGSGDARGAFRLACVVGVATFIGPLLLAHHSPSADQEFLLAFSALGQGSMMGVMAWLVYMALEPYARRVAPRWMVSWTRLVEGRVRDPMVGRDLLIGLAAAAGLYGVLAIEQRIQLGLGRGTIDAFNPHGLAPLQGLLPTLANVIHPATLLVPFGIFFVLVATRTVVRNEALATLLAVIVVCGFGLLFGGPDLDGFLLGIALVLVGARYGLLAVVAIAFFTDNFELVPIAADPDLWWSARSWVGWGAVVALALYAFRIATATPAVAKPVSRG